MVWNVWAIIVIEQPHKGAVTSEVPLSEEAGESLTIFLRTLSSLHSAWITVTCSSKEYRNILISQWLVIMQHLTMQESSRTKKALIIFGFEFQK